MRAYSRAYPLVVGRVSCGDWSSSVPDLLVADGRVGVALDEDPAHARSAVEEAVAAAADRSGRLREHPPVVSWTGGQFGSGRSDFTRPAGRELSRTLTGAHEEVTAEPGLRRRGAPYGSDLRLYAAAGIPTVTTVPATSASRTGRRSRSRSTRSSGWLRC